jgi:hypothetical protein
MTDAASAAFGLGYLRALYPDGPPLSLRVLWMDGVEGTDWRQVVGEGGECHLVWGARAGLGARFGRFLRITRLRRQVPCRLLGVHGTLEHPEVVVSLARGVLDYAHTVTFRYADSPLRIMLKRFAGLLPGALLWPGPVVALVPPCGDGDESLVLFSADRMVAFLFRRGEPPPYQVRKSGDAADLAAEAGNHRRAAQLLGRMVPDLLPGVESALTLEYIPEHTLLNAVASAWLGRHRVFEREALGHVTFCLEVYRRSFQGAPPVVEPVTAAEVDDLLAALADLPCEVSERERLGAVLQECVGAELPRLIQHGDFCVRNVLIAGGERGRVLIDWEDLQERRFPLADFALLRLSLKEAYAALFKTDPDAMLRRTELVRGLAEAEEELGRLLGLDRRGMKQVTLLSLACLCRQNLRKKRYPTARSIFAELLHISRT